MAETPDKKPASNISYKKTEKDIESNNAEVNDKTECDNIESNPECSGSSNNHASKKDKEFVPFSLLNKDKVRKRTYRSRVSESSSELDSDDDSEHETKRDRENSDAPAADTATATASARSQGSSENTEEPAATTGEPPPARPRRPPLPSGRSMLSRFLALGTDSDLDDDEEDNVDEDVELDDEDVAEFMEDSSDDNEGRAGKSEKTDAIVKKELERLQKKIMPKETWSFVPEFIKSQAGSRAKYQASVLYSQRYYDSLHVPTHLKLTYQLEHHRGCVNALNFNASGSLLASGSDDLKIAIWDWARRKTVMTYTSGHRNNVFHSKFLPLSGDRHIVSCARDGEVRLAELSSIGVCKATRLLAKHGGPAHKLSVKNNNPHEVLSVGEDSNVFSIDIREPKHTKVVVVKDTRGCKVALYSIHSHPINDHQYCVSGRDQYVRVYDRRISGMYAPPVLKYCPTELVDQRPRANVTSVVYSNNGDAILASYNDDDIYLFNTDLSDGASYSNRYGGHRNSATVKGVNFFSPSCNYIVSGSDCGNIFIWHRKTEAIVQCLHADNNGVVNVLEPHPNIPLLATSGLDNEVKIWMPICEEKADLSNLEKIIMCNLRKRHRHYDEDDGINAEMLTALYRNMMRRERNRRRRPTRLEDAELPDLDQDSDSSSTDNSTNTNYDIYMDRSFQCAFQ